MEVIIFENYNCKEIPEQDNPIFDYNDNTKERNSECIMVCKVLPYEALTVNDGYIVIYVPKKGDIKRKALFWHLDDAIIYANALVS